MVVSKPRGRSLGTNDFVLGRADCEKSPNTSRRSIAPVLWQERRPQRIERRFIPRNHAPILELYRRQTIGPSIFVHPFGRSLRAQHIIFCGPDSEISCWRRFNRLWRDRRGYFWGNGDGRVARRNSRWVRHYGLSFDCGCYRVTIWRCRWYRLRIVFFRNGLSDRFQFLLWCDNWLLRLRRRFSDGSCGGGSRKNNSVTWWSGSANHTPRCCTRPSIPACA